MRAVLVALCLIAAGGSASAEMRGHGGPVRALAVAPVGDVAVSGSFDNRAIVWDLGREAAARVLRHHDGAVNAVAFLPEDAIATGGADGRIAFWRLGVADPVRVEAAHEAPVAGLAVSPDGETLASAGWDGAVRLTPLTDGTARVLTGHGGQVNAVAFAPDGTLVSAGYDATLRIWPEGGDPARVIQLPTPLNALAIAPDGTIAAGGADGVVRLLSPAGETLAQIETQPLPIIALALSPDGSRLAAATIRGSVAVIDVAARAVMFTLVGPGLPVWSAAFAPDGETLYTGGGDAVVRAWDARTGEPIGGPILSGAEDPLARFAGSRGAEVFRACAACHTLSEDEGERAGPTLAGIFGRRIGTAEGYDYSPALVAMDIVWTPQTVAALFEQGPTAYTPGSKMPEQRILAAEDRQALVDFLAEVTR
ncbi:c-type cytochrome [Salinarimonas sp. NSM]|uniref:c-type cytochrome n=1 Tax=Salinarimonas sp. NSM TaxID=3458003 RepID=UPI004036AC27